jgi:hypothetical protein
MQATQKLQNAEPGVGESIPPPEVASTPPSRALRSERRRGPSLSIVSSRKLPSEKRFGLTLTSALFVLGVYGIFRHRSWKICGAYLLGSIVFGLLTLTIPKSLAPLNRVWFHLGELLGKIVSPIILGIIFFGILTPISLLARLVGRDELRLRRPAGDSYWIDRPPADSATQSFKNQF